MLDALNVRAYNGEAPQEPMEPDLDYLNKLLSLLRGPCDGRYSAKVDGDAVMVVYAYTRDGVAYQHESPLSLDKYEGGSRWALFTTQTDPGTRDEPPSTDMVELEPAQPWHAACRSLVKTLLLDDIDDIEYAEPIGGLDPSEPDGWDSSTGQE